MIRSHQVRDFAFTGNCLTPEPSSALAARALYHSKSGVRRQQLLLLIFVIASQCPSLAHQTLSFKADTASRISRRIQTPQKQFASGWSRCSSSSILIFVSWSSFKAEQCGISTFLSRYCTAHRSALISSLTWFNRMLNRIDYVDCASSCFDRSSLFSVIFADIQKHCL